MDSLPCANRQKVVLNHLLWFLKTSPHHSHLAANVRVVNARFPIQNNNYDCGCFLVKNALAVLAEPTSIIDSIYVS